MKALLLIQDELLTRMDPGTENKAEQ